MPDDPDSKQPPDDAAGSGSVEVQFSSPHLVEAAPESVALDESQPVSSGKVRTAVEPTEPASNTGRTKLRTAIQDTVSGGVERLGAGIGTIGEGVSKIGEATKKVPLVGAGVARIGEGLISAGESIHVLPRVAQTRRGRLLLRSVIVGFVLVFAWIAAIVALNLHGNDTPDFRPDAEHILLEISKGSAAIDKLYETASPRFQEMVRKERFVDDMTDLNATLGRFREITAVNGTLVTTGRSGKVGRVSLTASYDKGICKTSISFHYDQGTWKLLGVAVEVPPELKITSEQREQRVAACADPMDAKKCEIHRVANAILEELRDDHAGEVWDASSVVFQKQEPRDKFIELQAHNRAELGAYKRILDVTEAKVINGTSATFDVLAEFEKSSGVRTVFGFTRDSKSAVWQLRSLKIVVPMPRSDEDQPHELPFDVPLPPASRDAGVRDGRR
ncbi:MAG TPA: hypothetical protein VLX92_24565 [Kofleriaceae bacterium]|nr:hypothetical protein [Kofleriaceae bacterium]